MPPRSLHAISRSAISRSSVDRGTSRCRRYSRHTPAFRSRGERRADRLRLGQRSVGSEPRRDGHATAHLPPSGDSGAGTVGSHPHTAPTKTISIKQLRQRPDASGGDMTHPRGLDGSKGSTARAEISAPAGETLVKRSTPARAETVAEMRTTKMATHRIPAFMEFSWVAFIT